MPNILFTYSPFKIYEYKELLKDIKISKTDIILDIGCGDGLETILIGKKCKKIYGIDVSKIRILNAKLRAKYKKKKINSKFICEKLENLKFKKENFDKIFSICVLEHIPNYLEVLEESYRILKVGGQFLFSVDSLATIEDKKLLNYHKSIYNIEQVFNKHDLIKILGKLGFKNILVYPIFKSDYAKKLFIEGISREFKFGFLNTIIRYYFLKYFESQCNNKKEGIFLIVKCKK